MAEQDPRFLSRPSEPRPQNPASPEAPGAASPWTDSGHADSDLQAAPRSYAGYGTSGQGYGYGGYGDVSGAEAHLMDYLRTLYRRRWTALTAFAVVFLAVAVYTFTATPVYEGRVQLLIEPENPNIVSFKEVIEQEKATNEYYQTQYTILKSRALARRTIEALKLWSSPELGGGEARKPGIVGGAVGWVAGLFSGGGEKPGIPGAGETERQSRVIDAFLAHLTVSPIRNSRLVDLRFASTSPDVSARVTNEVAKEYIEQNLEYKFLSTKEASDWLGQQLTEQRKKVETSELALQHYREQGDAVALEDRQNIVVQRLADLNAAVTKARTERIGKEALYQQLSSLQTNRAALDTFPAILSNTFIQQLKGQLADLQRQRAQMSDRLGEKHPDMIKLASAIESTQARLDGEIGKVVQSVRNEFLSAQSQERSLAADLERQKTDALALNRKEIAYSVLWREAESNKQIYESLMQRAKETGISGELKTSNIRVVDQAETPRSPVRPNKTTNLFLGLLGGAMFGIGLAFFYEYLDARIKNPDEIKQHLGLTFLGLIPGIKLDDSTKAPLLNNGVPPNFAEAFRGIRTSVIFSSAEEGSRSLIVTSSQPSEGKTVVASNLAMSLAQTGQRVLLIDADMRKPHQHTTFNVKQEPGLSNLLVGRAKAAETVRKTDMPGLWLMPAGPNPPNPSELLGSVRFKNLLRSLGDHFDWVVVDTPPVLAVTDAAVVAHMTNGVVFVVGSEQVMRQSAQRAVEQLLGAKATMLGSVLNRVNVTRDPYYYSHYYKKEYANYYSSSAGEGKP